MLRGVPAANAKAHRGVWIKLAVGSFEARGKSWVSSAMVISARSWVFWLNRWGCTSISMISKANCR